MSLETEHFFNREQKQNEGADCQVKSGGCAVWQFCNETGNGTMTTYQVFPGAMVGFNDFHMAHYESSYVTRQNLLVIDHCREGRMEYSAGENKVSYIEAGDMKLDTRKEHTGRFEFPSSHYHGVTVVFDLDVAEQAFLGEIKDFPVTPCDILKRWQLGRYPLVLHGGGGIEHIFEELYHVPENIRISCFKLKILEILLYLNEIPVVLTQEQPPYFYKTQVEKVKAVQRFLTEHIEQNFTQEELSKQFGLPLTTMKKCFYAVYGAPIGTWLTQYRMNRAAEMLLSKKDLNIAQIGSRVGYDSASKFAIAFKKVMKMSPSAYRMERGMKHGN